MLTDAPLQVILELVRNLAVLCGVSRARLPYQTIDFVNLNVQVAVDFLESLEQAGLVVVELFEHEGEHVLVNVAILVIEGVLPRDGHLLHGVLFALLPQVRHKEVRGALSQAIVLNYLFLDLFLFALHGFLASLVAQLVLGLILQVQQTVVVQYVSLWLANVVLLYCCYQSGSICRLS